MTDHDPGILEDAGGQAPSQLEPSSPSPGSYDGPTETVTVSRFEAYEIPILRALEPGPLAKQALMAKLDEALAPQLLTGDRRVMVNGTQVWAFRASWTLSKLKKEGFIVNETGSVWSLTDTGRVRLSAEVHSWAIERYQGDAKATVRALAAVVMGGPHEARKAQPSWLTPPWSVLSKHVSPDVLRTVERRVRPDLGLVPQLAHGSVPRNLALRAARHREDARRLAHRLGAHG